MYLTRYASIHTLTQNLTAAANANLKMLSRGIERSGGRNSIIASHYPSNNNDHRTVSSKEGTRHGKPSSASSVGGGDDTNRKTSTITENKLARWLHIMSAIYAKTGISEIGLFFQKFSNW